MFRKGSSLRTKLLKRMDLTKLSMKTETQEELKRNYLNEKVIAEAGLAACEERFDRLLQRLAQPPMYTTLRINTQTHTGEEALEQVQASLIKQYEDRFGSRPHVTLHPALKDVIIIQNTGPHTVQERELQVIVDLSCGMAVLRGADVFAQGVMAAPSAMHCGSHVTVYADLEGKCRKGLVKPYEGQKLLVGNGICHMSRQQLFCAGDPPRGLAIKMTDPVFQAPCLTEVLPSVVFPQNLPSIICSHVLAPQPGETILDMCAAPGGKTCHIATLMKNKGLVIALDKGAGKVKKIKDNAEKWGLTCIKAYPFDATKAYSPDTTDKLEPPFSASMFDRILLDVPCSALGQRPSLHNNMKPNELRSYPAYQRKIISQAVPLLKPGGSLVYSTCTVTLGENEGQVAWILKEFPSLTLVEQVPYLGSPGRVGSDLHGHQRKLVQIFDPSETHDHSSPDNDTIGFFIAKFVKLK